MTRQQQQSISKWKVRCMVFKLKLPKKGIFDLFLWGILFICYLLWECIGCMETGWKGEGR
jgi:hypothetical protein